MLTEKEQQSLTPALRTMRIIVLALAAGPLAYLGFVLYDTRGEAPAEPHTAYMAAGFAALGYVAWAIIPNVVARMNCRKIAAGQTPAGLDTSKLPAEHQTIALFAGVFQTRLIIACAILDSPVFFNIFAYAQERQFWSLAIVGALLLTILASFPTRSGFLGYIERQKELMDVFPS